MGITIDQPYYLIGIPVLLALLAFSAKWFRMKQKGRRRLILALHGLAMVCLVLALCGIHVQKVSDTETTIFLLDVSDSMSAQESEMVEFVQKAIKKAPKGEKMGIVAFGSDTKVEQFVSDKVAFSGIETTPLSTATNLEKAVQTAVAMYDADTAKHLVLITDGKENEGTLSNMTYTLTGNQVKVDVLKLENKVGSEVYIDGIKVSKTVKIGDTFHVEVTVQSNVQTSAELSLYQGTKLKKTEKVELQTGENTFIFKDTQTESGLKTYRAEIEAVEDTQKKNNAYTAFTEAKESEKVLLVEGKAGQGKEFCKLLEHINSNYQVVTAKGAPETLKEMMAYKAILTLDVYADDLPKGFLDCLESYVKDYGGGFVAIGGENSYALGGYRNTSIEKVLPVKMDLNGEKQIPTMAIAYVIDHSSSMSSAGNAKSKLDVAKDATEKAMENMREIDEIGVLAFDDTYGWAVPLQKLTDTDAVLEKIDGINIGGGTSIYPAVKEAVAKLKKSDATLKHIILLSDGEDGFPFSKYKDILENMKAENITLSTVAVGEDADNKLMTNLSEAGEGRFYQASEDTDLPRIFAQEVYLSTKSYLNNREFTPAIRQSKDLLEDVAEDGLPSLLGYISTTAKDMATVYLESDKQEPILASWQYGLGRTVAFTSDGENKWTGNYANWDNYSTLWKNILQWVIPDEDSGDGKLTVEQNGTSAHITYTTKKYSKDTKVSVLSTDESGEKEEVSLDATGAGKFEKDIKFSDIGIYMLNLTQKEGDEVTASKNTAVAIQYSTEYRYLEEDTGFDSIIKQVGGTFVKKPAQVFEEKVNAVRSSYNLSNMWLLLALLTFAFYVAYSRLQFSFIEKWMATCAEKWQKRRKRMPIRKKQTKSNEASKDVTKSTISELSQEDGNEKAENKKKKEKPSRKKTSSKKERQKEQQDEMQNMAEMLLKKKQER